MGGWSGMDQRAIVEYRANMEGVFEQGAHQNVSGHSVGEEFPKHDSLNTRVLSH